MSLARQILEVNRPVLEAVEQIQRFNQAGMPGCVADQLDRLSEHLRLVLQFNRRADADLTRVEESLREAPGATFWTGPKPHPRAVLPPIPHANDDPPAHGPIIA